MLPSSENVLCIEIKIQKEPFLLARVYKRGERVSNGAYANGEHCWESNVTFTCEFICISSSVVFPFTDAHAPRATWQIFGFLFVGVLPSRCLLQLRWRSRTLLVLPWRRDSTIISHVARDLWRRPKAKGWLSIWSHWIHEGAGLRDQVKCS